MKAAKFAAALLALTGIGCSRGNDVTGPAATSAIVGTWASVGSDIAPGVVAAFRATRVIATFASDYAYTIAITDSTNVTTTSSGTWVAGAAAATMTSIELNQTAPSVQRWVGVVQVNGAHLTYEVVQTTPAIGGIAPPTIAGGFGSTQQGGVSRGSEWIQRFVVAGVIDSIPCNPDDLSIRGKRPCDSSSWSTDGKPLSPRWDGAGKKR